MGYRGATVRGPRVRGLGERRSVRIPGQMPRMIYQEFQNAPFAYAPTPIDYASLEMQNEQREAEEAETERVYQRDIKREDERTQAQNDLWDDRESERLAQADLDKLEARDNTLADQARARAQHVADRASDRAFTIQQNQLTRQWGREEDVLKNPDAFLGVTDQLSPAARQAVEFRRGQVQNQRKSIIEALNGRRKQVQVDPTLPASVKGNVDRQIGVMLSLAQWADPKVLEKIGSAVIDDESKNFFTQEIFKDYLKGNRQTENWKKKQDYLDHQIKLKATPEYLASLKAKLALTAEFNRINLITPTPKDVGELYRFLDANDEQISEDGTTFRDLPTPEAKMEYTRKLVEEIVKKNNRFTTTEQSRVNRGNQSGGVSRSFHGLIDAFKK